MPKITNLKSAYNVGKNVLSQTSGTLESISGAAGRGGFSASAGPNGVSISANFNEVLKNTVTGNRVVSPVKELFDRDKFEKSLQYPSDLDDEHYMIYKVMKRRRKSRKDEAKIGTYQNIILPIPSNLQVQQGVSYADTALTMFGAAAAGRISASDISDATSSLSDAIGTTIKNATDAFKSGDTDAMVQGVGITSPALATGAGKLFGGSVGGLLALGGTAGGVVSGVSVSTGLALNPHMAVVFQGVGFRTHNFTYKFIARNQDESDEIKDIINTFKYAMLPSYEAGGLAFRYPEEFEIKFSTATEKYLYDIGTCVLQDVQVNYNGEGIPLFFENTGAPVSITLGLTFKETQIHTKERLEKRINY